MRIASPSRSALEGVGFEILERREPSLLLDESLLVTGEVDRTTDFEQGLAPSHQAERNGRWRPDPLVLDDQALVVEVRDRDWSCSPAAATPALLTRCAT